MDKLKELNTGDCFKAETKYGVNYLTVVKHLEIWSGKKENAKVRYKTRVYSHSSGRNIEMSSERNIDFVEKIPSSFLKECKKKNKKGGE